MKLNFNTGGGSNLRRVTREIKDFKGGVNKLLEEARIALNEAKEATNLMQVQDGLWKPRWGTAYYGADVGAVIDGAAEFVKEDGTTEKVVVAGGTAYKATDGGSWSSISGASFTPGVQCFFLQIANYLYIANGEDDLARYNGTVLSQYTELSAPANLAGSRNTLTSGSYTLYAEVTALNEVGETVGSTEASITVNKVRNQWTTGETITWTWDAVADADRYQIYLGDQSGQLGLIPASITTTTFIDDGSLEINPYVEAPLSNTTSGPKFRSMTVSGNRIWGTNDPENPFMVHFSGSGSYIGVFSDFYGGGWINLERGGRERPNAVIHYQSGGGEGRATILCSTPEGKGAVWQITISSATVGDTTFSIPSAQKVVGSSGTDSQLSVTPDNNNIWFTNRRGIFTLGPEKQYYGLLRTNELSSRIRPYIRNLIGSQIDKVCAYFYDAKVFFSVPTSSSGNNRIIYYDTERTNWVVDWSIGAKQFFEYTDSNKNTHFLYVPVNGTRLIELSPNIQGDLGEAFSTTYTSGRITLNKFWKDFLKLKRVFVKLGNPRGQINFEISGASKSEGFSSVGSATISPAASMTGMGFDLMGEVLMGNTGGVPSTFSDSADPRYIKVNKKLRDIQFRLTTSTIEADYTLQSFILEGNELKVPPPSSWKISN